MKKKYLYIKFSFFILFFGSIAMMQTACETENSCQNSDTIDGIIDTIYDLGQCFQYMHDTSYVINDIVQFKQLKNKMDSLFLSKENGCDTAQLIAPDFTKYTLLAFFTEIKACDVAYKRSVIEDNVQKKYIYSVELTTCGDCNYMVPSMNWILVPKIPENYTVEFKVLK